MVSPFKSFERWSWSQLSTYRSCPFQARLRYIEREPEPEKGPNDPRDRGIAMHKAAEDYLLGEVSTPVRELEPFIEVLDELKSANPLVEHTYYLDSLWRQTTRENAWLKFIPDVHVTIAANLTGDWKTGKKFGNEVKHYQQMELYAVGAWCVDPSFDEYLTDLYYIDQKDMVTHVFKPEQLEKARARLDIEANRMMQDKIHTPRPSKQSCKWCPYSPRGTGACPVGV